MSRSWPGRELAGGHRSSSSDCESVLAAGNLAGLFCVLSEVTWDHGRPAVPDRGETMHPADATEVPGADTAPGNSGAPGADAAPGHAGATGVDTAPAPAEAPGTPPPPPTAPLPPPPPTAPLPVIPRGWSRRQ